MTSGSTTLRKPKPLESIAVPDCPTCAVPAVLRSGADMGWKTFRDASVWMCPNFARCGCMVSCHPKTMIPLGTLAGADLRRLRKLVHHVIDPLWLGGTVSREGVYHYMGSVLGIDGGFHVGGSTEVECRRILQLVKGRLLLCRLLAAHARGDEDALAVVAELFGR